MQAWREILPRRAGHEPSTASQANQAQRAKRTKHSEWSEPSTAHAWRCQWAISGYSEMCPGRLHCKGIAVKRKIYVEHGWIARGQEEAHLVNLHASPSLAGNRQSSSQSTLEITEEDDYGALEPPQLPPPNSQAQGQRKRRNATQQVMRGIYRKITR